MSFPRREYELIQQLAEGDAHAFTEVFELYKDTVFAFAYTLTKSRDTAEEVVQDVFLKLWEKRGQIRVDHSFAAYVKKITYHQVIDIFRKAKTDKTLQQRILQQMEALRSGSEEQLLGKELEKMYREAIEQLPPQQKKVFLLSRETDMTYEEIAQQLGVSRNTVRNQVSEAIRTIRVYVSSHSDLAILVLAICMNRR